MNFLEEINSNISQFEQSHSNNQDQSQRTAEWYAARLGRFTGSKFKDLMSVGTDASKKGWDDPLKVLSFGAKSIRYIYNVAQERRTGIRSMDIYAKSLEHGKEYEPLLIEQLLKDRVIEEYNEVGFIEFQGDYYAGASADGSIIAGGARMAYEGKATTSWDGHYNRFGVEIDEKHGDFWQIQGEMIALRVNKCLFAASYPGVSNQYDYKIVELSHVHKWALLQRLKLANQIVELFIEGEGKTKIARCIEIAVMNFEFI